jgi:hypothetical protein
MFLYTSVCINFNFQMKRGPRFRCKEEEESDCVVQCEYGYERDGATGILMVASLNE